MRAETHSRVDLEVKLASLEGEIADLRAWRSATTRVLQAVAAPSAPVAQGLGIIAESVAALCNAPDAVVHVKRGDGLVTGAHHGQIKTDAGTFRIARGSTAGRCIVDGKPVHVHDLPVEADAFPDEAEMSRRLGYRTALSVPILAGTEAVGAITLRRLEVAPFGTDDIALLQTFSDQAAVAIRNAQLFTDLEAGNRELNLAQQKQTATADVLKVISRSQTELKGVLEVISSTSRRLCEADYVHIYERGPGGGYYLVASEGIEEEYSRPLFGRPFAAERGSLAGRAALERRTVHIPNVLEDPDYTMRIGRQRTGLGVPLLRGEECIGVIVLLRTVVNPFTDAQIRLVETFADQAVIAIENTRLFRELGDALQRQTAAADVLGAISRSTFDVEPVFHMIAAKARQLCSAKTGAVFRFDGDILDIAAIDSFSVEAAESMRRHYPMRPGRGGTTARAILTRSIVYIPDIRDDSEYDHRDLASATEYLSTLSVPMLHAGEPVGAITVTAGAAGAFSPGQIELLKTFADQAVVAIENSRLFSELREALQQQTATADVLKAISRSTFDLTSVLSTLIEAAVQLCDADQGTIARERNGIFVRVASHGFSPEFMSAVLDQPIAVDRGSASGRALVEGRMIHIPDVSLDSDYDFVEALELGGFRTIIGVPMLRDGAPIGVLALTRREARPFTGKQMDLLASFADQAAIAIENARLFESVQGRTRDLQEALEQQVATSAILRVIASSPADLAPVLHAVAENAARLCDAADAKIFRVSGESLQLEASVGSIPIFPSQRIDRGSVTGRSVVDRRTIHVHDLAAEPEEEYPEGRELQRQHGHRTTLATPLVKQGEVLGAILIRRMEMKPFSEDQIRLLETFADQAAIAIENARLFEALEARTSELQEALTFQKASANVLEIIGRSGSSVQPVLDMIIETAADLCRADMAALRLLEGGFLRQAAANRTDDELTAYADAHAALPVDQGSVAGRVTLLGETVHIPDVAADSDYTFLRPFFGSRVRTVLGVPLISDGAVAGVIILMRRQMEPFSPGQIELVQTFANHAVIALDNARLFAEVQARTGELQEALDYQTATSEVLGVISRSVLDVHRVFRAIGESALRLCGAERAFIFRYDGEVLRAVVGLNASPELADFIERNPIRPGRHSATARAALERRTVHIEDVTSDPEYSFGARDIDPLRTNLAVPIIRGDALLGVITIYKLEVEAFTPSQVALLETFADQAAIAIENARLFETVEARTGELQEALDYQTATSEVLGVISRSAFDLKQVFEAVGASALRLCEADKAFIFRSDGDLLRAEVGLNASPEMMEFVLKNPIRPGRGSVTGRAALERRAVQIRDASADPEYSYRAKHVEPIRTNLGVPILKDDTLLGVITIYRFEVADFTPKQVALLETFADQVAIAIENARLFEALQAALAEFNAVLDNIDYGVLFMDRDLRTRIVNPALRRLWDLPQDLLDQRPSLRELLEYNRDRGVYTTPPDEWEDWVAARIDRVRQGSVPPGEFVRADGKVYTYQCVALPDGGRMLSYFDITELKHRQAELLAAKEAAETALVELKTAQERLVQTEKLASLGQLTAGIAHEIKNPLNFVNNFAALSRDLLEEMEDLLQAPIASLAAADRDDAGELFRTVRENLDKIAHHGSRADSIVRNMLQHARQGSGEWREADINAIAEEALNLAYHGARAEHPDFNVEMAKHLDPAGATVECCPQDIMRVILNLVSNGIYAANKKRPSAPAGFAPRIELTTRSGDAGVAIEVRDNGTGIPAAIRDSVFLPFFTTKPAGEGTGLGLSLSHDIVVKQHGGSFEVESEPGAFTLFRVTLPRKGSARGRTEP